MTAQAWCLHKLELMYSPSFGRVGNKRQRVFGEGSIRQLRFKGRFVVVEHSVSRTEVTNGPLPDRSFLAIDPPEGGSREMCRHQCRSGESAMIQDLVGRSSVADVERTELSVLGTRLIESHLVDDFFQVLRVARPQGDHPFPVIQTDAD